jgi:hypothetical protein
VYTQNPWELVVDPLGSAKHNVGTTGVSDKILLFGINIRIVIGVVKENE